MHWNHHQINSALSLKSRFDYIYLIFHMAYLWWHLLVWVDCCSSSHILVIFHIFSWLWSYIRYNSRFFVEVGHETTYASSEKKITFLLNTPPLWRDLVRLLMMKLWHTSSFSFEHTDFKNVIFEKIHWAHSKDAEVAEVKQPQKSKRRKFYYEKS